jgi:hypothetical protein
MMNCTAFELWLDARGTAGMPGAAASAKPTAEMQAHVASCGLCRDALAAARAIDAALAAGPPGAPAGFTARVLSQITSAVGVANRDPHVARGAIGAVDGIDPQALTPWWRMLLADPAFVFALCCAVLAVWLSSQTPSSFALLSEWAQSFARLGNNVLHGIPAPQSAVARASLWTCAACAAAAAAAILGQWTGAKARRG